jgi:hypothetical protein
MSEIITNKLTGKTAAGNVTITSEGGSATMQLQQGVAKAWINYKQAATFETRDSLNISSVSDDGSGLADTNYTNNFNNDDYAASGAAGRYLATTVSAYWTFPTRGTELHTTAATAWTSGYNGGSSSVLTPLDMFHNVVTVHGDLA